MTRHRALFVAGVLACSAVLAVVGGRVIGNAKAAAPHKYTLHVGDKVSIPAIRQTCSVQSEARAVELVCAKSHYRHQVTIFRHTILVWTAGNPDHAAWHGKP